ncbi:MAG: TonB-dependent receptor [Bacteroidia bacterium]|nr:TonB-dependent receptor [Bacteroidia bacterium]NNC86231.1 TonB-dependent receptor [Bacteroidia bacterium]NNM15771.1 TonB-dependent receptor [Bacteroidia bacterium]
MKKSLLLSLLFAFIFTSAFSQTGTIRGFVYNKSDGEPILFTNVYLKGTTLGAATDVNGYYSIVKIPAGTYTLLVTVLGYDSLSMDITVSANDLITKNLYLNKGSLGLKTVNISAEKIESQTEVQTGVTKVTPDEIKIIPSVGGEPDIAQYLQILPGVVFSGDQGGQLYIRGGTPIQNKVLLDGMVIYNPFHSIGLFSVFDQDYIKTADVYTGGFGSEYGGRISSIMDIKTRDGNKKKLKGLISASPFQARMLLEGPLKKAKSESDGTTSFVLSVKNSYLDQSSKTLYEYVDKEGLPYSYTDVYGKIVMSAKNGSKLNLFGLHFEDDVTFRDVSELSWRTNGGGASFVLVPSSSSVLINGTVAVTDYGITLTESDGRPRESNINGFNVDLGFNYFLGKNELKYGFEFMGFSTDFIFFNSNNRKIESKDNSSELAGFFNYKGVFDKLVIEPGMRLHYYASLSEFSAEPRFGAKYNISDRVRVKASAGLYSQNFLSASSDRDVVSLFQGFLSSPDDLQDEFKGDIVNSRLQKAQHAIIGAEFDLPFNFSLNVEGYIKRFTQLTNLNREKIFDDTAQNFDEPDNLKKDFIIEDGDATGVDFLLKYQQNRLYLWGVYSLGLVERDDGFRTYNPHFDRRHNINMVGSYSFGKGYLWSTSVRWNFGSGFPFSQTAGFFEMLNFGDGINSDYTGTNGELGIVYGPINEGRLPVYHRLDVSVTRTFPLGDNSKLEVVGSLVNAYDQQNIFYFDRIRYERVDQLPVLPSLGASLRF